MAAAIHTTLPPLETAAIQSVRGVRQLAGLAEEAFQAAFEFDLSHCHASLPKRRRRPAPVAF